MSDDVASQTLQDSENWTNNPEAMLERISNFEKEFHEIIKPREEVDGKIKEKIDGIANKCDSIQEGLESTLEKLAALKKANEDIKEALAL